MAKDGYFVPAYRILKYLPACFKTGELADTEMFGPAAGAKVYGAKITQKGIEFLQDRSRMKKAADFLRTVKDAIPGF